MEKILPIILGLLFIILGVFMLFNPIVTLIYIWLMIGAIMIMSGIIQIGAYFRAKHILHHAGWLFGEGALDIILGILFIFTAGAAPAVLPFFVAIWMIIVGVIRLFFAIDMKKSGMRRWSWLLIAAILAILLGILIMFIPAFGAAFLVALTAFFVIYYGIAIIVGGPVKKRQREA